MERVKLEIRDTASPILPIALDPVSKSSVTFNPDIYQHPHTNLDAVIISGIIEILEGMDDLFIVKRSNKARCAFLVTTSVFLAALAIATEEGLYGSTPISLVALTAIFGATDTLMGVGFYLKDHVRSS